MFDNLKKAFSDVSKGFSEKELKENDIDDVLFQLEISLWVPGRLIKQHQ